MKLTKKNTQAVIRHAGAVLRRGGTLVYPTDTAYALGGIFNRSNVIKKILKIKKRQDQKFTLIASSQKQAEKFFHFSSIQKKITRQFWPGALSLVVSKKNAVRVPDHDVARQLAGQAKTPLIATSANVSGQKTPYDIKDILYQLRDSGAFPDLILDAGILPNKKPSTIVRVKGKKIKILRQGPVKLLSSRPEIIEKIATG